MLGPSTYDRIAGNSGFSVPCIDVCFIAPERATQLRADARLIGGKLYALIRSLGGS